MECVAVDNNLLYTIGDILEFSCYKYKTYRNIIDGQFSELTKIFHKYFT